METKSSKSKPNLQVFLIESLMADNKCVVTVMIELIDPGNTILVQFLHILNVSILTQKNS